MVEAARRNNRVVQVGSQQRSGLHFQRAVKYVRDGKLDDIHYVVCWNHGGPTATEQHPAPSGGAPSDLDWDMWLGPAPKLSYDEVWTKMRRTSWDFFGGMITEWGCHFMDIALWGLQAQTPISVVAQLARRSKSSTIPKLISW